MLYKFSLYFCKDRLLGAVFIAFFAFLFSHFDILLWSSHIHLIAGFIMLISGFMIYMEFLKREKRSYLFYLILLFLGGMFCYEAFFLWPLGILILSSVKSLRGGKAGSKKKANTLILTLTYGFYFLFYVFVKSLGTYESSAYEISDFLKFGSIVQSGFLVLFNTIYNNIAVNLIPFLAFPFNVRENIYMAGPVINYIGAGHKDIVFVVGALAGLLISYLFYSLYKKKRFEELKIIGFFLFLMLSEAGPVFLAKFLVNPFIYSLTEFRYQYIPNAFVILIVLVVFSRLLRPSRKARNILYIALSLLFILNVYCIRRVVNIYDFHFAKLQKMLTGIKTGIKTGEINKLDKLYIDKELPDYLPHLCWNIYMGEQFIPEGNYQWMFSRKEVEYFAESPENASWIINKKTFDVVENSPENRSIKGEKIVEIRDRWHMGLNKSQEYVHLGDRYTRTKRYREAEGMLKKAIELNPRSHVAYSSLGHFYNSLKRYREAEDTFREGLELNPGSYVPYSDLGHFYNYFERYKEAEEIFKKAIEVGARDASIYDGLGAYYLEQERYEEAEEMFKKALELDPDHRDANIGLKTCYKKRREPLVTDEEDI